MSETGNSSNAQTVQDDRKSWLLLAEAIIIFVIFWADMHHWVRYLLISKTPWLLLLGWISLRLRGLRWSSVGLRAPQDWRRAILFSVTAGLAMEALELFCTQPLLVRFLHEPPDLSELASLRWNWPALALVLLLTWTLAAFGEEMVWRGYILNRMTEFINRFRGSWLLSALLCSALFGLAHFSQGRTGVIENFIDGALLAALYFASGRNLWVPIIAHGVTDSADCLLIFLGHYPTM